MSLLSRLAVQAARAYGILSSRSNNISADYLVVAGGGGSAGYNGGGAGAGGLLTSTFTLSTLNTYSITVGAGGTAGNNAAGSRGTNGADSIISGTGLTTVTSTGGGTSGSASATLGVVNGSSGGSGGGAGGATATNATVASGTSGQGNAGGDNFNSGGYGSGGGGGASAVGGNGTTSASGNGGAGTASSISGSSVTYAGGGGGGSTVDGATRGTGGAGGGGDGGASGNAGTAGTVNTGGGGGGGAHNQNGAAGGSGIVIISYTSATPKFVGGTITTSGGKQIHTFTSSGTLSPVTPITAEYLVVAGGAGGGTNAGGGGGAGGLQASSTTLYSGATYVVTVGAGGAGGASGGNNAGSNGSNSVVSGTGLTTLTSVGGGGGGKEGSPPDGASGGSGGGGHSNGATIGTGGAGTSGQGYAGGSGATNNSTYRNGGGGGGASAVGATATSGGGGAGGNGTASSISGSSVTYAGGGGGGSQQSSQGGAGGTGGGGAGTGGSGGAAGGSGTTNLGAGGGGGAGGLGAGGSGGSGIVIISYAGSQAFNGGLVTTSGGNTIHTFTSSGALTPLTNNLNNSLRFRSSASAYLSRTPTVAGNRKTWTWSAWVKRGTLTTAVSLYLFEGTPGSGKENPIVFGEGGSSDKFSFYGWNGSGFDFNLKTTQVFRDISAWYHLVVAVDTTQATSSNRVKIYVNGNQISAFDASTYPSQNYDMAINNNVAHRIGTGVESSSRYFDGYMADINFIDGQALEPYYFGNNDANGVWKPILYKGTYGTNGFYLNFADTSALTTSSNAGLGKDTSGNGNYWTTNNISITSGTTYDAMTDVPTNTSATVANYATINPLLSTSNVVLSEANLKAQVGSTGGVYRTAGGTFAVSSGKWYWELVFGNPTTGNPLAGVGDITVASSTWASDTSTNSNFWYVDASNGNKINGTGGPGSAYGSSFTTSDTCMVALDMDNGKIWWGKNGTWFASGDPAAGTNAAYTNLTSKLLTIALMGGCGSCGFSGNLYQLNFGQRPFAYTPPTGYVALNTYNLPTPTILQGNKYMDATLYTGNGSGQTIVNQALFQPDFVWVKSRSVSGNPVLVDSVRGANKVLYSPQTTAEETPTAGTAILSFNSNGFSLGGDISGTSFGSTNGNTFTYVGWQWQAGQGSTSSNTSGSITSTVSVNTTAGFSVVTYTGTGANATVGHGLGVAPKMVIVKRRNSTGDWLVWNSVIAANNAANVLFLNTTDAQTANSSNFNSTAPTSTVFSVGTNAATNASGGTHVAYCWAEIAGYSKFGSYAGNSSTDGPFIYLGFRPKFVIFKDYSNAHSWIMVDSSRNTYNVAGDYLRAESSAAENATYSVANNTAVDFLSNGFKLRNAAVNSGENNGSSNYLYMAWAENPFKNSNAR